MARPSSRWTFHFTPTSASWLNAVEGFFATLTRRRLKRSVFRSVDELKAAINRFVAETNADPKPFVWTADPNRVLAAVKRGKQALKSIHYGGFRSIRLRARELDHFAPLLGLIGDDLAEVGGRARQ